MIVPEEPLPFPPPAPPDPPALLKRKGEMALVAEEPLPLLQLKVPPRFESEIANELEDELLLI